MSYIFLDKNVKNEINNKLMKNTFNNQQDFISGKKCTDELLNILFSSISNFPSKHPISSILDLFGTLHISTTIFALLVCF